MDTILLVEDYALSRDALSRRLARSGYAVALAGDGEEAIALVRAAPPDLILMDLGLPRLDGWAATKQLKADTATRAIPIIVLSAHPQDRETALAAGADDLDIKPIRFSRLLVKIAGLIRNRG